MTFILGENHDQHYTCTCGRFLRGQLPPAFKKNWICGICQQQLIIFMDDSKDNTHTVTRHMAKTVQIGDWMVHRNGVRLAGGDVMRSHQYGAKPSNWFLAVRGHGSAPIAANDYVNIEYNPIVNVVLPTQ